MYHEIKFGVRMLGWIVLGATLITGCASPSTGNRQATEERDQAQIQQRLQEIISAAESKDFNRLDSYHLYGPKFTKFSGSSPARQDAAAGQKGEHDGLGAAKGLKMQVDAMKIDVFEKVGVATFILDYGFEANGETLHSKERTTMVFVKEGQEWKIAHEHLSPIGQ